MRAAGSQHHPVQDEEILHYSRASENKPHDNHMHAEVEEKIGIEINYRMRTDDTGPRSHRKTKERDKGEVR